MPTTLSKELRNQLAKVTAAARTRAESACRAALENLAVHEKDYRSHMTVEQRQLRNHLRARGRALGDRRDSSSGTQEIRHLAEAAAYEHWHRLLFTRFLAENNLLHTDEEHGNVPVTLRDCDELAPELGARDGFELACRFAAKTLPGVFRSDDPVLDLRLAINDQVELRKLLDSLPSEVFTADDSLGWTYQFWQAQRKEDVNRSGKKIGADELPAVTQLFTEDYMVEFLLHNTLGAWWAGKLGPVQASTEEEARAKVALPTKDGLGVNWNYLRFVQDDEAKTWSPAAGIFSGWPTEAKLIKFLDPCMGSGHFLVFTLPLIARMRMEEEGLTAARAVHATLSDNIFGLELDERCSQIAAFNLALTAWKLGGYQSLPVLHLACSGLAPNATEKDWVALAGDDDRLKNGMTRLYELFRNAPVLGSLINPRAHGMSLLEADFNDLQPLLEKAVKQEAKDDNKHEMAVTASGLAKAAEILAGQFALVATNVPYLARGKQDQILRTFSESHHGMAKEDLATTMMNRCTTLCVPNKGTIALVTPQNWFSQDRYAAFRADCIKHIEWSITASLGAGAFRTISGEVVKPLLFVANKSIANSLHIFLGRDFSSEDSVDSKSHGIQMDEFNRLSQFDQLKNPKFRIDLNASESEDRLLKYANYCNGIQTGDGPQFIRLFYEISAISQDWEFHQTTAEMTAEFEGMRMVLFWQAGRGRLVDLPNSCVRGKDAWGKSGVLISAMGTLQASRYLGHFFDDNTLAIIPNNPEHLTAIWACCSDPSYNYRVRLIDQALKVRGPLVEIPFDLEHWQKVAAEKYPDGLPRPYSSDPTQWVFNGHPKGSDQPLHVAVARLLGYRWPRQTGSSFPDCPALGQDGLEKLVDADGIVCLLPINREQPAANRLRTMLAQALGQFDERTLIAGAGKKGSKSITFEDWLREEFFEQHCELFYNRPFIWHVWDGRKDGFHALVNYHKLDHAVLQKLTYSYLGDWIRKQDEDARADVPGADLRLGAARELQNKLANILKGEAPYDIFVRWKPISKQAIGWNPDINDGVRMNIRPFATADVLRKKVKIKWDKDRGKEPHRDKAEFPWFWCENEPGADPVPGKVHTGHRWNNVHLTLAFKRK